MNDEKTGEEKWKMKLKEGEETGGGKRKEI